jgi:hypothetical protein
MIEAPSVGFRIDVDAARQFLQKRLQELRSGSAQPVSTKVQFLTQADNRVRPEHAVLHGTVWDAGDPDRPIPPLDHNCRCYVVDVATDAAAAKRLDVPLVKNPPTTPAESIELMKKDSGGTLTTGDIFGQKTGELIDSGKLNVGDAITDTGAGITSIEASLLASGIRKSIVVQTLSSLKGMGVGPRELRHIISEAKRLDGSRTARVKAAVLSAVPGAVAGRSAAISAARAAMVAKMIARIAKGLL